MSKNLFSLKELVAAYMAESNMTEEEAHQKALKVHRADQNSKKQWRRSQKRQESLTLDPGIPLEAADLPRDEIDRMTGAP